VDLRKSHDGLQGVRLCRRHDRVVSLTNRGESLGARSISHRPAFSSLEFSAIETVIRGHKPYRVLFSLPFDSYIAPCVPVESLAVVHISKKHDDALISARRSRACSASSGTSYIEAARAHRGDGSALGGRLDMLHLFAGAIGADSPNSFCCESSVQRVCDHLPSACRLSDRHDDRGDNKSRGRLDDVVPRKSPPSSLFPYTWDSASYFHNGVTL